MGRLWWCAAMRQATFGAAGREMVVGIRGEPDPSTAAEYSWHGRDAGVTSAPLAPDFKNRLSG